MSMNVGSGGSDEPMMDVNTTPLIDVMLVLIVMFIITLPVMTHAVKLDMPAPNSTPQEPKEPVVIEVEIDYDGSVLWNGTQVDNFNTLESYFRTEGQKPDQAELHIRPNRRAKYDAVAKVLALAQRNGMTKIGFVGNEQFM